MCFQPTKEETARHEALRAITAKDGREEAAHRPWDYPHPRGNQETDARELERSTEKLATVIGH